MKTFFWSLLDFREKTLQLRGQNYIISTEVWSRLQKRTPMQNFTIEVLPQIDKIRALHCNAQQAFRNPHLVTPDKAPKQVFGKKT